MCLFWPGELSGPACKRHFRKLLGAEDLLQVVDARAEESNETWTSQWGSHCVLPLCLPQYPHRPALVFGSLSAPCRRAAPGTTFPSFTFNMWFGKRKKGGTKRVTNVICFGGEVTVPANPFPASSSGATVAGMAGTGLRK